jgi:thiol-disulfide isomerase/thioredoxin
MRIARLVLVFLILTGAAWAQREDDAFIGQKAPEIKDGHVWINSRPLKLESLKGKVVVIDFWAFDCPNCAQAMPHVMDLHKRYSKDGLVIIGVHTPRIDKEKDLAKVREAVRTKQIPYPVVVDNKYDIWGDYACDAWPNIFVIDQEGTIQLSHTGIGRYEDVDKLVAKLLAKKSN